MMNNFFSVPSEIMFKIFLYCCLRSDNTLNNMLVVCPKWYTMLTSSDFITDLCVKSDTFSIKNPTYIARNCDIKKILANVSITKVVKYHIVICILGIDDYDKYLQIKDYYSERPKRVLSQAFSQYIDWEYYIYHSIVGERILYDLIINKSFIIKPIALMKIVIKLGYEDIIHKLILDFSWSEIDICSYALYYKQTYILKKLLYEYHADKISLFDINQSIYDTIENKDLLSFKILMELCMSEEETLTGCLKYESLDNDLLSEAIYNQCVEMSIDLIRSEKINPTHSNNNIIYDAVSLCLYSVIEELIKNPNVNPTDDINDALELAIEKSNEQIIDILLQSPNVNIKNSHIKTAIKLKSRNILLKLLQCASKYVYYVIEKFSANNDIEAIHDILNNVNIVEIDNYDEIIHCFISIGVKSILEDVLTRNYPLTQICLSFIAVVYMEHINIIEILVTQYEYIPSEEELINIVINACKSKNKSLLNYLLNQDWFDPSFDNDCLLRNLSKYCDYPDIINKLLHNPNIKINTYNDYPIRASLKYNNMKTFMILFANNKTYKSSKNQYLIRFACHEGLTSIVELLLTYPDVCPGTESNLCIKHACKNGYVEIVRILMNHISIDPTADGHEPLKLSVKYGHLNVVKELCKDWRINPAIENNKPLRLATKHERFDILEYLLSFDFVDPGTKDNAILRRLIQIDEKNSQIMRIIKLIAAHPNIDPHCLDNVLTNISIISKDLELISILLDRADYNPSINNNKLLHDAIIIDNPELIKKILDDSRVTELNETNYSDILDEALMVHLSKNQENGEVLDILLNHEAFSVL